MEIEMYDPTTSETFKCNKDALKEAENKLNEIAKEKGCLKGEDICNVLYGENWKKEHYVPSLLEWYGFGKEG